jgi:hypothetical protein
VDGKKEGFCMQTWEDGSQLKAFFKNNKAEGICVYKDSSGSIFQGNYIVYRKAYM